MPKPTQTLFVHQCLKQDKNRQAVLQPQTECKIIKKNLIIALKKTQDWKAPEIDKKRTPDKADK